MKLRRIILGWFLLQCFLFAHYSEECFDSSDPNLYISDPNVLQNGLFEYGDPNKLTPYRTIYDFVPPLYWERIPPPNSEQDDCYAGLFSEFSCVTQTGEWHISHPYEGSQFIILSTGGDSNSLSDESVKGSGVSQDVYLYSGDTILGAFFFGTRDYAPFNDHGQVSLVLAADPNDFPDAKTSFVIPGSYCDVEMVGNYRSTEPGHPESDFFATTDGWVPFSYTVEPNMVGPYSIICEVIDYGDTALNSYYAVDGLRICRGGKPQSDINSDCNVNLIDYSILAEAWLSFCPDPPFYDPNQYDPNEWPPITDPNIPCQLADIDNNWFVDMVDLGWMANEWLYNTLPPVFMENPIQYLTVAGLPFNATLKSYVSYPRKDALLFCKVEGPDWLTVAPDGSLSGTPLISDAGENSFTVQVDDRIHSPVQATLLITVLFDQPPPFTNVDIGPVGLAGDAFDSEGIWTIQASGAATDPNSDECHFVYLPANGDCDITARIDSLTEPNQLARVGVMIRETLSAGAKSVSVSMANTTSFFQYRQTTDQNAVIIQGAGQLPRWIRLVRIGNELTAYESQDGLVWDEPIQTVTVEMTPDVYIGLAATSYDNSQLTTAVVTETSINN